MKNYTVGLNLAGQIQFIITIRAKNLNCAVMEWASLTNHMDPNFDPMNLTYFGWPIVETEELPMERKPKLNPFQY